LGSPAEQRRIRRIVVRSKRIDWGSSIQRLFSRASNARNNFTLKATAMTAGYAMRILFLSAVLAAGTTAVAAVTKHDASAIAPLEAGALRALPLAFEQNVGQSHARVHFV